MWAATQPSHWPYFHLKRKEIEKINSQACQISLLEEMHWTRSKLTRYVQDY